MLRARLRHCVYPIAAGDHFFESPPRAAFAAWVLNALPMWRRNCGRHAMQQLQDRLVDEPCGYILFPEGTRSRDGVMGRFRPGIGMMVAGTGVPVVPCHLEGAHTAFSPDKKFPRPRKITLRVGPAMQFQDTANDKQGWQQIAASLEEAVRGLAP